jgi:hypothetical protein
MKYGPYLISHHHMAALVAVMAADIRSESATNLNHSQCDTHAIPSRLHAALQ